MSTFPTRSMISCMRQSFSLPLFLPEPLQRIARELRRFYSRYPIIVLAIYLSAVGNLVFWTRLPEVVSGDFLHKLGFSVSFFFLITGLTVFLLQALHIKYLLKPALIIILLGSALASYFMHTYGIVIDTTMIHNVLETDTRESMDLLTGSMLVHVALFGLIPALFVYRAPIIQLPLFRQIAKNGLLVIASLLLIVGNFLIYSSDYTSFFRNHHHMRYLVNPANYIYSIGKVTFNILQDHDATPVAIGLDATRTSAALNKSRKSLVVIVVGETARAKNFSINGYNRITNPVLGNENIINFPNFYSCGTSTHVSLPCMFSMFGRNEFDESRAKRYEKLPDVLQHAGVDVLWLDNNSGCKGVCKNTPTRSTSHLENREHCTASGCFDEIMLSDVRDKLDHLERDTVIFLHQNGSHGPAYYQQHPENFGQFSPECKTNDLGSCSAGEVINAYDNTILYTDYFLGKVIALLKNQSEKIDTAMLYISDHGESLGEHNIYLHSMPYMIAPDEQKHVPFIAWFSDQFAHDNQLSSSCVKNYADRQYSHDNLFHTLLGLTQVSTSLYKPEMDIFQPCHTKIATGIHESPAS